MGTNWSSPKIVKDGKLIVINSPIPRGEIIQEKFWKTWKLYKDDIKNDGFSISKYKNNMWTINYFRDNSDKMWVRNSNGEFQFITEFNSKLKKWEDIITSIDLNNTT